LASFYLDQDVDVALAPALQEFGHTAVATGALGLARSPDAAQLLFAAKRRWVLISHNRDDFVVLHDAWKLWTVDWDVAVEHAGILVIPQRIGADFWTVPHAAGQIDELIRQARPLSNELYEWRRGTGWNRRA
jgi:hypothetical protein